MTNAEYQQLVEFLGRQFTAIDGRFAAIDRRFDTLEHRVDEGVRDVLGHFDEIYPPLDRLEQEDQAIVPALRRIQAMLADERGRPELLERSVEELKQQGAGVP